MTTKILIFWPIPYSYLLTICDISLLQRPFEPVRPICHLILLWPKRPKRIDTTGEFQTFCGGSPWSLSFSYSCSVWLWAVFWMCVSTAFPNPFLWYAQVLCVQAAGPRLPFTITSPWQAIFGFVGDVGIVGPQSPRDIPWLSLSQVCLQ